MTLAALLLTQPFAAAACVTTPQEPAVPATVTKWLAQPPERRAKAAPETVIPKDAVAAVTDAIWSTLRSEAVTARKPELEREDATKNGRIKRFKIQAGGKEMRVLERTFGKKPEGGHSLWISMHGGGGTAPRVNDGQWRNQIQLYEPKEGIYVAPRAPTNTWNLWHEGHIDDLFDHLIANYIIDRGINPNRIYLMGYSAGGDGVYKLAPRMADRFAAASMMAGHPNGEPMDSLRNLPFMIWMGEKDGAYKRNEMARQWGKKLDELQAEDPDGYVHETHIVAGKGHWMDREDAKAVPWMAKHTRNPWPKKVVWRQAGRLHDRFYWLGLPKDQLKGGQTVRATVDGQTITLQTEGVAKLHLRLSDQLVDLDRPITVTCNGKQVFEGKVERSVQAIHESLLQRLDPTTVATAKLPLTLN